VLGQLAIRRRLGDASVEPHRIKFKRFERA
jgi:hypothetical protein